MDNSIFGCLNSVEKCLIWVWFGEWQLPLTRPKSPKLSRRRSFGDPVNSSPEACSRARHSTGGGHIKSGSNAPFPHKNNIRRNSNSNNNGICKPKERSKVDKETKTAPPNITDCANPDISVQSWLLRPNKASFCFHPDWLLWLAVYMFCNLYCYTLLCLPIYWWELLM